MDLTCEEEMNKQQDGFSNIIKNKIKYRLLEKGVENLEIQEWLLRVFQDQYTPFNKESETLGS